MRGWSKAGPRPIGAVITHGTGGLHWPSYVALVLKERLPVIVGWYSRDPGFAARPPATTTFSGRLSPDPDARLPDGPGKVPRWAAGKMNHPEVFLRLW